MAEPPLRGIRVLDLTRVWSGPLATRMFGDLGAEVIKIEAPYSRGPLDPAAYTPHHAIFPDGDPGHRPWNRDGTFNKLNRSKLGLTLDLTTPAGVDIFKRLVAISDIVIENYSTRVMGNFRLDYPVLREINPSVIVISLPGFGDTGPYKHFVSWGTILESISGVASLMGYPDGEPLRTGSVISDPLSGIAAAGVLLIALWHREETGQGQYINLSQSEMMISTIGDAIVGYSMSGEQAPRRANRHPDKAPQGCYRCRGEDKWVAISVGSDEEWRGLCQTLGNPPWTEKARFNDHASRYQNHDELDRRIEEWTQQREHYEAMHLLQIAGVPAGAVLDSHEMLGDPHLAERDFFVTLADPDAGTHAYPGLPIKLSDTPARFERPTPTLGQHNRFVMEELLGLSDEEIAALVAAGAVVFPP